MSPEPAPDEEYLGRAIVYRQHEVALGRFEVHHVAGPESPRQVGGHETAVDALDGDGNDRGVRCRTDGV